MLYMRYAAVFTTEALWGRRLKAHLQDVTVEVFPGPREYVVQAPSQQTLIPGPRGVIEPRTVTLSLSPDDWFISLTVRSKKAETALCETAIDNAMLQLSAEYRHTIFDRQVLRGWLLDGVEHVYRYPVIWIEQPQFEDEEFSAYLSTQRVDEGLAPDMVDRAALMARFYVRALLMPPCPEWLIAMWTVLEVYPMQCSTNCGRVSTCLASILGLPVRDVSTQLQVGRLYGIRCTLVHDGDYRPDRVPDSAAKLQAIVDTVVRQVHGLPYRGDLDRFLGSA